jgi:hypothetical protein
LTCWPPLAPARSPGFSTTSCCCGCSTWGYKLTVDETYCRHGELYMYVNTTKTYSGRTIKATLVLWWQNITIIHKDKSS